MTWGRIDHVPPSPPLPRLLDPCEPVTPRLHDQLAGLGVRQAVAVFLIRGRAPSAGPPDRADQQALHARLLAETAADMA